MPTPCPWTARVWREFRAYNLTQAFRDVLLTLRTYRGAGGLICPSHATLAERARVSITTVQRALRQADHLGLVRWFHRRARAGWRVLRTSSRYWLLIPETAVIGGCKQPRRQPVPSTGHLDRGGESKSKKEALGVMLRMAAALGDLLAARRAAMEKRLLGAS